MRLLLLAPDARTRPPRRSFADAEKVCGMVDGHLASFKNAEEFSAVVEKLVSQTEASTKSAAAFWLGATAKVSMRVQGGGEGVCLPLGACEGCGAGRGAAGVCTASRRQGGRSLLVECA